MEAIWEALGQGLDLPVYKMQSMKRRGVSSSKERKKGRGEKRDRRCPTYPSLSGLESSTMLCTVIRENLTVHELAVDSCQKKLVARNKRERRQRHDRFAPSAPSSAQGLGRIGFLLFLLTPTLLNQLHKPVRLPSSLSSHFQQSPQPLILLLLPLLFPTLL
jgi:hypothetical protein